MSSPNSVFVADTKICERCGEHFPRPEGLAWTRYAARRFCSAECRTKGRLITTREPCQICGELMRPPKSLVGGFPGTVARWNSVTCIPCHKRGGYLLEASLRVTVSSLEGFLLERRRRGADPEGVLFAGEKPDRSIDQLISY